MKKFKTDLIESLNTIDASNVNFDKTTGEGLNLDYAVLLPGHLADQLMARLEDTVEYYKGDLTKVLDLFGHFVPKALKVLASLS